MVLDKNLKNTKKNTHLYLCWDFTGLLCRHGDVAALKMKSAHIITIILTPCFLFVLIIRYVSKLRKRDRLLLLLLLLLLGALEVVFLSISTLAPLFYFIAETFDILQPSVLSHGQPLVLQWCYSNDAVMLGHILAAQQSLTLHFTALSPLRTFPISLKCYFIECLHQDSTQHLTCIVLMS